MKKSTESKAMDKERRKELTSLRRQRKSHASLVLRELISLRQQANQLVNRHRETDLRLARRIAILETRLS